MHISSRQLFLDCLAPTSESPLMLEIQKARGLYLFDVNGKAYMDLISGIAVSNLGHGHPAILNAIQEQSQNYMHLMVYGEYIQSPQVLLGQLLASLLPASLNCTYLVNSGAEAIEGAMKLAKRYTGRSSIISFKKAYHGSTQGALSIMGEEFFKNAYRPLLPDTRQLDFNSFDQLAHINSGTAAVFIEPIQGEAGVILPEEGFLEAIRKRCDETGALMVLDEIQTGFGRTGTLFAFEGTAIVPDILCLAKAMGGGMPIGAFIASREIMKSFAHHPPLGHITTFGGHPVCAAAALANLGVLTEQKLYTTAETKGQLFARLLKHTQIKAIRQKGLMLAIEWEDAGFNQAVIRECLDRGVITDWFLFNDKSTRIAPPLIITEDEIKKACTIILESIHAAELTTK